jgi:threonine/homoserine/homoserine lactone efflux protein
MAQLDTARLMPADLSPAVTGLGLGIALAGAPGPVQAILLAEALRGGTARGLRALLGANLTFGVLLIALALGLSVAVPNDQVLRILKVLGGALLVLLGVDGFRARDDARQTIGTRAELPPAARGALAVALNPGAWLFLATAASSLVAAASQVGGRPAALSAALALLAGVAAGDTTVVLAGGFGLRRAGAGVAQWLRRALALSLAGLGTWLLVSALLT